jgi:hypothetical protein
MPPIMDPRFTVTTARSDWTEYHRQRNFLKKFPEWQGPIPSKEITKELLIRKYKKSDPRITAKASVDKVEYNRQKKYIENHPDCKEVPPKRIPLAKDPRITADRFTENREFQRQYVYLKKHPDCKEIPTAEEVKKEVGAMRSQLCAERRAERIKKAQIIVDNRRACGLLNPQGRPTKPPPCPTSKIIKKKVEIPSGQVIFGGLTRPKGEHYNHHYNGWRNFVVMFNPHV